MRISSELAETVVDDLPPLAGLDVVEDERGDLEVGQQYERERVLHIPHCILTMQNPDNRIATYNFNAYLNLNNFLMYNL